MTSEYGAYALHTGQGRLHARTRTHPGNRTDASAHTQICNASCVSTATMIRKRASLLRYTCIACLVLVSTKQRILLKLQLCDRF